MPPDTVTSPDGPAAESPLDTLTEPERPPDWDSKDTSLPSNARDPPTLPLDEEPPRIFTEPAATLLLPADKSNDWPDTDTEPPSPAAMDTPEPPTNDTEPPTEPTPPEIDIEPPTPALLSPDDTDNEPPTAEALLPTAMFTPPTEPAELEPVLKDRDPADS